MNNGDPHLSPNVLFVLKLQTKALKRRPGVASIPSIYHILEAFFSPLYLIFNFFFPKNSKLPDISKDRNGKSDFE